MNRSCFSSSAAVKFLTPLAMLLAQITANMSSTFLANKLFWLVLGFTMAAGRSSQAVSQPVRPAVAYRLPGRRLA